MISTAIWATGWVNQLMSQISHYQQMTADANGEKGRISLLLMQLEGVDGASNPQLFAWIKTNLDHLKKQLLSLDKRINLLVMHTELLEKQKEQVEKMREKNLQQQS